MYEIREEPDECTDSRSAEDRRSACDGLLSAADVCSWKRRTKTSAWFVASCGRSWFIGHGRTPEEEGMSFCPMCGGKIVGI